MSIAAPTADRAPDTSGPDYGMEAVLAERHGGVVAGVDEAGRGPLAGPVVAAAVILDIRAVPEGLDDSKKLCPARREDLFERLRRSARIAIGVGSVARIERTDIRQATLYAMARAVAALSQAPSWALVDGRDVPPDLDCGCEAVIKGDGRCLSIAAASIVAKVTRDRMMRAYSSRYPDYGFDTHMGYGTAAHLQALERLGACAIHRRTFRPVAEVLGR